MTQLGVARTKKKKGYQAMDKVYQPHYEAVAGITDLCIQQAVLRGDLDIGPTQLCDIIEICQDFMVNAYLTGVGGHIGNVSLNGDVHVWGS